MQHIGIVIENEKGDVIKNLSEELNFADILNLLIKDSENEQILQKYPLVMSIKPYGDTSFNSLQASQLLNELMTLKKEFKGSEKSVQPFIDLCEQDLFREDNLTIRFIGD